MTMSLLMRLPEDDPQIIFQDKDILVMFKPAFLYVHPPEQKVARKAIGKNTLIHWIKRECDVIANPIHRLDFATEGLVLFGLNKEVTQKLNQMMRDHQFTKKYDAIARGWFKIPDGEIDIPLELDSTQELVPCLTLYQTYKKIEVNQSVNSNFPTARYSWLKLELKTGRWHQIRRHLNRTSHPIIGDREHGDSHHNRFFRENFDIDRLCLKASHLEFIHPTQFVKVSFNCPQTKHWDKINQLFNQFK